MKTLTKIIITLLALSFYSCNKGKVQETKSVELKFKTYTDWQTKYDENNSDAQYYELTIPDFFEENNAATVQIYHYGMEDNHPNSTISLIDKKGAFLTTLFEPTEFHEEITVQFTTLLVGDIDNNGLNDIKIYFSYMGNGWMAYYKRAFKSFTLMACPDNYREEASSTRYI